ncbi:MAG: DNA primase [Patescibacteria group bacterium]
MDPIEQIKQRIDIADFVREYFPMQLAGSNYKARCPFHQEKNASFMVSVPKQIWHCFGCNEGGDIFSFAMKMEGLDFAGALRLLAERAGVKLERQDPRIQGQKNQLLDLIDLASRYYHQALLKSPKSASAREYLERRGIDSSLIDEFRIGYAFGEADHLYQFLISKKCTPQDIVQAGLAIQREQGYGCFDRFRDRIMIPIRSVHGDVVGFGGRILVAHEQAAKYINSPQTPLYDKSATLFGLDKAKHDIRKEDGAILVEGYLDFLAVYGTGMKHVVASSGTALTSEQLKLLKRFTHNISFAFDMDAAGSQATRRGIEIALKEGMNVRIIQLPRDENGKPLYKDPDECIKNDPAVWKAAWENRVPFFEYLIRQTATPDVLRDGFAKKQAARTLLDAIRLLPDRIEQDHWVGMCAQELNIPHALLWEELLKHRGASASTPQPFQAEKPISIHDRLASLLFRYPLLTADIRSIVTSAMFAEHELVTHVEKMFGAYDAWSADDVLQQQPFDSYYTQDADSDILTTFSLLCDKEYGSLESAAARELAVVLASRIREQHRKAKIEELQRLMAQAERTRDTVAMKKYLEEFHCLQQDNVV